jgi:predicted RNase H-like nuclease (RuvC/YqgF family)
MITDRIASIRADIEEAERQWAAAPKQYRTSAKGIRAACVVADVQLLLAELAEKERSVHEKYKAELITQNDQLDRYEEQITALTARIKELESLERLYKESLEKYQLWKFDDEARIKELEESPCWEQCSVVKKNIARIKELEGALEPAVRCYNSYKHQTRIVTYADPMGFWRIIKEIAEAALGGKE